MFQLKLFSIKNAVGKMRNPVAKLYVEAVFAKFFDMGNVPVAENKVIDAFIFLKEIFAKKC